MARKKVALLMTVGTGVGDDLEKARNNLAHGMLYSIWMRNPDWVVFFGSESSKLTVDSLKKQFSKKYNGEELDFCEFVQIENIDSFDDYFSGFKSKIMELEDEYNIIIDYTSGTKTMTMSAAMASMIFRKDLIFIGGKRDKGTVVIGTEQMLSQNLYPIYDNLVIGKIKNLFNINRFDLAKILLDDIVDTDVHKETYSKLLNSYSAFDSVKYEEALKDFNMALFTSEWAELSADFQKNIKALQILNKDGHAQKQYYILASLINNARRRYEEHKYDDAIARLYRSLELIGQIKLEEYMLDSSDIDISILEEKDVDKEFIDGLESLRTKDGKIKVGLIKDFEIISYIDEDLGQFYRENEKRILNIVKFRNSSILAHGMEAKTSEEYEEFRDIVLSAAKVLNEKIDLFIEETMFPEFK